MIKLNISRTACASSVLILAACATVNTQMYPTKDGQYTLVSTSSEENPALKSNLTKAKQYCESLGKTYVITSQKTKYQGVDKNLKRAASVASDIAFFNSNKFIPTAGLSDDNDYKVITRFQCR